MSRNKKRNLFNKIDRSSKKTVQTAVTLGNVTNQTPVQIKVEKPLQEDYGSGPKEGKTFKVGVSSVVDLAEGSTLSTTHGNTNLDSHSRKMSSADETDSTNSVSTVANNEIITEILRPESQEKSSISTMGSLTDSLENSSDHIVNVATSTPASEDTTQITIEATIDETLTYMSTMKTLDNANETFSEISTTTTSVTTTSTLITSTTSKTPAPRTKAYTTVTTRAAKVQIKFYSVYNNKFY